MSWISPVTLCGERVTLEPLSVNHTGALCEASRGLESLWYTAVPGADAMQREIERRLALQRAGSMLPFALIDAQGVPVGMTTYMHIDAVHHRVEIGSTWVGLSAQRTGLNTEAKALLLGHAFEQLGCIAVEFRTHRLNQQSRRAIERLGAQLDGILRSHQRSADGNLRDTCVYSVTAAEWPTIRTHLRHLLSRAR